ncbi:protein DETOXIFICATION 16-like isoform X2 [Panicum miliaceum]|uniref:Protein DETOXIFICATION 16-like isoform X2 n=1 Tax=Panicum miliaceum TaxID=4540 RepID=A0A3L6QCV4_PANMI|nr:protein DETOXIFICATION 16-like isoform X2 [Panicum miliaceum]
MASRLRWLARSMEWWSFELLVLLSGLLPNPKLETAVLSICLNTNGFAFMVPLGLGGAIITRVSNELGAGRPEAARLATRVVVLLALAVGASEGLAMVLVRNLWGYAYSNEEEVVRHTARMMPILAVSIVFDGLQCVLSGVVRGCGRQKAGAFINLAAYYLAGIPSAFVLAFVWHLGGMARSERWFHLNSEQGLWFGIMFTNWNKEALKAKDRVFSSALPADTAAA